MNYSTRVSMFSDTKVVTLPYNDFRLGRNNQILNSGYYKRTVSVSDFAKISKLSRQHIYRLIDKGVFAKSLIKGYFRNGASVNLALTRGLCDLDKWLQEEGVHR